ncbi:MAG: FkbM family methyltransferase [Vicinamibacteria bacterium]
MTEARLLVLSTATKIRIAQKLYSTLKAVRRPFGGIDQVTVRRQGLTWNLDLREGIDLTIYTVGAFERDTLKALRSRVREGDVVLDIGANVGAHTLHLARLVGPTGHVIAFEPTDFAVAKLKANLRSNPDLEKRVEVRQVFLGATSSEAPLAGLGSSWPVDGGVADDVKMGSRTMQTTGATVTTLDEAVDRSGRSPIALIKMDVDGHELEVIEGAVRLLARDRPTLVMELAPYVFHPTDKFDRMVRLLTDSGYGFRPLSSKRPLPTDPAALRALIPREGSINVVAFPLRQAE